MFFFRGEIYPTRNWNEKKKKKRNLKVFKRDVIDKATANDSRFRLTNINFFNVKSFGFIMFPCPDNATHPYVKQPSSIFNTLVIFTVAIGFSSYGFRDWVGSKSAIGRKPRWGFGAWGRWEWEKRELGKKWAVGCCCCWCSGECGGSWREKWEHNNTTTLQNICHFIEWLIDWYEMRWETEKEGFQFSILWRDFRNRHSSLRTVS